MPNFAIVGFASNDRVPGFVGQVRYGAGAGTSASLDTALVLVGTKTAAGTAVADSDVVQIQSTDDVDSFLGAGSEIARMCYAALQYPGVVLYAAPCAEAGGAAAATVAVTFTSNAVFGGTWKFRVDGLPLEVGVASGDTPTVQAAALAAAVNAQSRYPVTATSAVGVTTITRKSKGVRGNQGTFVLDGTLGPTGTTAAVTTGTAMSGTGRFRFQGGTGSETLTNVLALLKPRTEMFLAAAQNDATSLSGAGNYRDWANERGGPLEGRPVFVHAADTSGTQPTSVATGVNDPLFAHAWQRNGESHPSEVAASMAAMRSVEASADPAFYTAGKTLLGVVAQVNAADKFARATLVSCLNNGITPINTSPDNRAFVVRGITTKTLTAATPDYSTYDWADAYVPQVVRLALGQFWTLNYSVNNPRVAPDPLEGEEERKEGIATPSLWNKTVYGILKGFERGFNGSPPILIDVDQLPPASIYDATAKRIMSLVPVRVSPGNYAIGVTVAQTV